ncbi:MAG TPA: aldo/keto reductase [Anaerolineae bacterium]|nr:aldo/keto reductase [Anaerolineae bacterium]
MEYREFGKTGLKVSRLGMGLSELGYELTTSDIKKAERLLNIALDGGINFLDTAGCYLISEELIGRTIAHRRKEYILVTKAGHVAGGYDGVDWSYATVKHSIERSLVRMKTDYIDLVQLHSCHINILRKGDVIRALQDAQQEGKTRHIGYSGDNEHALWAIKSDAFATLQTTFNLVDQKAIENLFPLAKKKRMGIIAKRPIANGVWGKQSNTNGYTADYLGRAITMKAMGPIPQEPKNPILTSIGFVLAHPEVDTIIIGTINEDHLRENIRLINNDLPISSKTVEELHHRFNELGAQWLQLI